MILNWLFHVVSIFLAVYCSEVWLIILLAYGAWDEEAFIETSYKSTHVQNNDAINNVIHVHTFFSEVVKLFSNTFSHQFVLPFGKLTPKKDKTPERLTCLPTKIPDPKSTPCGFLNASFNILLIYSRLTLE